MVESQYILDIFDLAFDHHPSEDLLRKQILFLTVTHVDYTGAGVFIYFQQKSLIQQFKIATHNAATLDADYNPTEMIAGVEIENPNLQILADAIVHLNCGLIDHVEIWNKGGEEYLQTEPEEYKMSQTWLKEREE